MPSCVQLFLTPWTAELQATLSLTIPWSFLKFMSIASVMPSNHLILCHPLLLTSIFPSIRVLSIELALLIRWPKYWSFSISSFSEYPGLISFKIEWLDILALQGTLKSLLQHHNLKASVLQWSASLWSRFQHDYWKDHSLDYMEFCLKVMSLLVNKLSRFVIAFLPRNNHLLISWLQSSSAVILDPKKKKSVTPSTFSPSICHEVTGPNAMNLVFVIFLSGFFTFLLHPHQ